MFLFMSFLTNMATLANIWMIFVLSSEEESIKQIFNKYISLWVLGWVLAGACNILALYFSDAPLSHEMRLVIVFLTGASYVIGDFFGFLIC